MVPDRRHCCPEIEMIRHLPEVSWKDLYVGSNKLVPSSQTRPSGMSTWVAPLGLLGVI